MHTKKRTTLAGASICAVLAFSSGTIFGQDYSTPSSSPTYSPGASPGSTMNSSSSSAVGTPQFVLGSKLMGCQVKDQQGQELGTISNFIVNPNTGRIRYAVLSANGKEVTVPWSAFNLANAASSANPHLVLNATKQKLASAPKFDPNDLSNLSNRSAEEPIFTYYELIWFPDVLTPEEETSRNNASQAGSTTSSMSSPSASPYASATPYGSVTSPYASATPYGSVTPVSSVTPSPMGSPR